MGITCSDCGTDSPNEAAFCWKCGQRLDTHARQEQPALPWKYQEFSQTLGNAAVTDTFVYGGINASGAMDPRQAAVINEGVRLLLDRVSAEGWEPAEAIDATSLAKSGKVSWTSKEHESLRKILSFAPSSIQVDVTLHDVRVLFRRCGQYQESFHEALMEDLRRMRLQLQGL